MGAERVSPFSTSLAWLMGPVLEAIIGDEQAIAVCNGQKCFRVVASQRSDPGDAGPCPFIQARYGKDDLCRCCDGCRSACRDDIKDPHA